jgi:hypothetical protein
MFVSLIFLLLKYLFQKNKIRVELKNIEKAAGVDMALFVAGR